MIDCLFGSDWTKLKSVLTFGDLLLINLEKTKYRFLSSIFLHRQNLEVNTTHYSEAQIGNRLAN